MKFNLKDNGIGTNEIIGIAVALLMIAIILPIGLNEIGHLGGQVNPPIDNHYVNENWGTSKDVLVVIVATVVPILAVLGIAMKFM